MKGILPLPLAALALLSACAKNPVTGDNDFTMMTEAEEIALGKRHHSQILRQYGLYPDRELQAYVDDLGQKLAANSHRAHLDYRFTVLDSPEINAFALPGGYIYITRGIMAYLDSEAELAGVLGHEIGHVTARHSVRQQSGQKATSILGSVVAVVSGIPELGQATQQIGSVIGRGYGRDHELEADRLGAQYLHRAGYDPEVMLKVIGVLKDQEVFERARAAREGREPAVYHGVYSTHPKNDDRLKTVVRASRKLAAKDYRDVGQSAYHERIDGIDWGPSPRLGILHEQRFAHPGLRFKLALPEGWQVENLSDQLRTRDPETRRRIDINLVEREEDETLQSLLRRVSGAAKLPVSKSPAGWRARTTATLSDDSQQPARLLAVALDGRQTLLFIATAPKKQFPGVEQALDDVEASFRRLSAADVAQLSWQRLRIVERGQASFASLAVDNAIGGNAEDRLRLLNRSFPEGDIGQLERIKTVVRE